MAAGMQTGEWSGTSRRRVPRFRLQAPMDVLVTRGENTDRVPGRSLNLCERGMGAVVAGELVPGETVAIEIRLAAGKDPLKTSATVRYQDKLRCGLEFAGILPEQRTAIRDWAKDASAELPLNAISNAAGARVDLRTAGAAREQVPSAPGTPRRINRRNLLLGLLVAATIMIAGAAAFWWKWNRGWEELESGLKRSKAGTAEDNRIQVPTEVMQKLLVHRVQPVYPAEARSQHLQGIVALDVVVATDGSVMSVRALNGPDVLAQAAIDALRWWRFDPYRVNGKAVPVETTMAVEFKP